MEEGIDVPGAGRMLCEEFRVEGCEVSVFGKYGDELGINDLGNFR